MKQNELFSLTGKTAIVTGGSGRLGPIWIETLEEAGARVFVLDLPTYDVSKLSDVIAFRGILPPDQVPTIIVNSAAIDNPPGTEASFFGNVERILDVNLIGAVNVTKVFMPGMVRAGGGVFINIGSIQGNIGADWRNYEGSFEKPVGYNLSKAALIQLSRSVTVQYGRYGVRGVTIAFGPYDAGLPEAFKEKFLKNVPLGRAISKQSIQTALLFACACPELAGQQVLVDGGYCAL